MWKMVWFDTRDTLKGRDLEIQGSEAAVMAVFDSIDLDDPSISNIRVYDENGKLFNNHNGALFNDQEA